MMGACRLFKWRKSKPVDPEVRAVAPDARDVAKRMLVLRHMVMTMYLLPPEEVIEGWIRERPTGERKEALMKMAHEAEERFQSVRTSPMWGAISPMERVVLNGGLMAITKRDRIVFSWRLEGVQVLMWAMGVIEVLPAYDEGATKEMFATMGGKTAREVVEGATLRPREEIKQARSVAELWHWRCRTRQLIERGDVLKATPEMEGRGIRTFDDIVRMAAARGEADGLFESVDGDFPACGKAYRELSADEWSRVRSITMERHFALNWLCGYSKGNRWDETPTGT